MDLRLLEAVTAELRQKLSGARIDKIFQPEADILILRLWNGRESLRLLLSPAPRFPRLHLTTRSFPNPAAPPRFCQLLRARLSRVRQVEQVPGERIVHLHCQGPQKEDYLLAVELLGRRANLVLVDALGLIVDVWARDDQGEGARQLMPGRPYRLPDPFSPPQAVSKEILPLEAMAESPSAAVEAYYERLLGETGELGEQRRMLKLITRRLARVRDRLDKIQAEENALREIESWRERGELLLANLHRLKKGLSEVALEDYYQDPPRLVTLALDPRLIPAENAEQYFRRYKKMRRGAEHIARRLEESRQELTWLEEVRHALEQAQESIDLVSIRGELEKAGLLAAQGSLAKRQPTDLRARLRSATSPGGYRIFWGRDNRTNDYLTRELAEAHDWWFHAKDLPGSHLVLKVRRRDEEVPEEDLRFAAALAAGYSRGAEAGKVEVMLTRAGEVRKPKGAPPGLVRVQSYRSLMVAPKKLPDEKKNLAICFREDII